MDTIRAIDLCAGAGGWACAARGLPIEFIAVADLAADCLETWSLNHQVAHQDCLVVHGDLTERKTLRELYAACKGKKIDLILGAIPCEQLSTARGNRPLKPGEMEGVHDLIDSCFAIVKRLRPRWWCFEDVIAVEGHIPSPLDCGLPYECRRINASCYGPQKRIRTFFGAYPEPAQPEPGPRVLADVLRPGPYRTLPQLDRYERSRSKWYGQGGQKKLRVQDSAAPAGTVISSQGGMGSNAERSAMVPVTPLARVLDAGQASPTVLAVNSRHERAALVPTELRGREKPAPSGLEGRTVISGQKGEQAIAEDGLVRVLEWQEAALLQGFPADYVFAASWSRTWKLVAQAIPVYVGRAILRAVVAEWKKGRTSCHATT